VKHCLPWNKNGYVESIVLDKVYTTVE